MALPVVLASLGPTPLMLLSCQQSTLQALETCLKSVLSVSAKDIGSQVRSKLKSECYVCLVWILGIENHWKIALLQLEPLQQASVHLALAQSVSCIYQTFLRLHGSSVESSPFAKDMVGGFLTSPIWSACHAPFSGKVICACTGAATAVHQKGGEG